MRLESIELHLYKPLMHNGVKHVQVEDMPNITVIAGENGSGKSSLLRECTPYPACRTDYEKGGSKRVVYTHGGSTYVLTSDFSKATGAHSFVKDGIELNESGTTEVQNELVESNFDYNDVISKLVSGKYKLCDMGKPDRKTLIMSTYPSSLSFMLDYHRVISSNMRAIGNNIKMLSQRELSLKGQIISPTILNDYKTEREDLNKAISVIDVDVYTINKAIEQANDILKGVSTTILNYTPETFIGKMKGIQAKLKSLYKVMDTFPEASQIKIVIERINNKCQAIEATMREDSKTAMDIRNEIDQYERYLSSDNEENIAECKRLIETQNKIIESTVVDQTLPTLSREDTDRLKANYTDILNTLTDLKQSTTPFWTVEEYKNVELRMYSLQQSISTCNNRLAQLNESIQLLEAKLARQTRNTWPKECNFVCPLRNSLEEIIRSVQSQIDVTKAERDRTNEDRDKFVREFDELKTAFQLRRADRQVLLDLERYFYSVSWGSYALNDLSLIESLNSNITKIYNNITLLISNAEKALAVKEAKELKTSLEAKLLNLENSSGGAEQLIRESLVKKEAQLNEIVSRINNSKQEVAALNRTNMNNQVYDNLIEEMQRLESDYTIWKRSYVLQQEIKEFRRFIEVIMNSRMRVQTKLRELDTIIKEQDGYLIRLNDEVLPELMKLQKQYDELSIIESQISPTKGIPHLYTTKYINSILLLTNKFISRVWSYPMELQYIDEKDESFDFSFPVILNGNSSIKDCNMCSNGQRSIIDLCFALAICIFRQYSQIYPLIFDESTSGLSIPHSAALVIFLSEIFNDTDTISQVCIVDHNVSIASSFSNSSKMINLSKDQEISEGWTTIGNIS